ncbi:ral GTPase-activating protein subunit beta-like isoform X2 [Artemia franciscana]|uniref:ral GTPase-activating protein subunit beta-like isoform X2 n=1 Tax=Artemia franciscana TaxID=6661 RepID=UPI0032D9B86B
MKMYSEWASMSPKTETLGADSILSKFSNQVSSEVVAQVAKQLYNAILTGGKSSPGEERQVKTHQDVVWCMEVLNQGLDSSSDPGHVKDCVWIYCDWLTSLLPIPKAGIPSVVVQDPVRYGPLILKGLFKIFSPRKDLAPEKQAVFCHRVLRTIQTVAAESVSLASSVWHSVLMFLLAICDSLLSPPCQPDDLGGQMCERLLSALFEVWLLACAKSFPSPPQWKTLNELCQKLRHRPELIDVWNRCIVGLIRKLLPNLYGPDFPVPTPGTGNVDQQIIVSAQMSEDSLIQSWYRILHCIGNPCDLVQPSLIAQTQTFLQYAFLSQEVVEPSQHPCLSALPRIFLKAIRTVAFVSDSFLGLKTSQIDSKSFSNSGVTSTKDITTLPPVRRPTKSFSGMPSPSFTSTRVPPSSPLLNFITSNNQQSTSPRLEHEIGSQAPEFKPTVALTLHHPLRPKCATLLHLVGEWLFEAAIVGCAAHLSSNKYGSTGNLRRPGSSNDRRVFMQTSASESDTPVTPPGLVIERFDLGRAEALGALCRIVCSKKTGEEIPSVYLARFCLAVQQALKSSEGRNSPEVVSCFLLNAADLFRLDLDGINMLLSPVIDTLELILYPNSPNKSSSFNSPEIRRSCIQILISLLPLPLHFQGLPVRDMSHTLQSRSFGQYWKKLWALICASILNEVDWNNILLLLGAIFSSSADFQALEQRGAPAFSVGMFGADSDSYSNHSLSTTDYSIPEEPSENGDSPMSSIQTHSGSYDSAGLVAMVAATTICQRLISAWKTEVTVTVAVLETLDGLARLSIHKKGSSEAQKVVKSLCELIIWQCSRPPPAHSKDLHSAIVAAFQCLGSWLSPALLNEPECLSVVLEVIELGISGSTSHCSTGQPQVFKHEKLCKPVSLRVRDAAETLLYIVVELVDYFPSVLGASHIGSLLNEETLAARCGSSVSPKDFRYFATESGTILSLLEEPLGNHQDPQPTVTLVLRNPRGRFVWTMQHRQLSRHSSALRGPPPNPGLPLPLTNDLPPIETTPRCFPEVCDLAPEFLVDKSIPSCETVVQDIEDFDILNRLVEQQTLYEKHEIERRALESNERKQCQPPLPCTDFQAARLILSHLGMVTFSGKSEGLPEEIVPLDSEEVLLI